jgi:hypothetical protein
MKLRYVIGGLMGAAFGTGLGYLGGAQVASLPGMGIGALIGAVVGLFIVARASVSAGPEDASSDASLPRLGGG